MDDIGEISLPSDVVKRRNLAASKDELRGEAMEWNERKKIAFTMKDMYRVTDNDVAVMRGIAKSGALGINREVGGLYDPKRSFRPCVDLPSHPESYMEATGLYKCGLTDLVLGSSEQVVIMWPFELVAKSYQESLFMWHTHPDQSASGLIHSPPSIMDFRVAVEACRDMAINVDQFIITKLGLWRLRVSIMNLITLSRQEEDDGIENFNFYAAFIQSDEEVAKTNMHVDPPFRRERMTPEKFVEFITRNVKWFTIEYYSFS